MDVCRCARGRRGGISAYPFCPFWFLVGRTSDALEPDATRSGRSVTPRTGPAAKTITFREEREGVRKREGEGGREEEGREKEWSGDYRQVSDRKDAPGRIAEYGRKHSYVRAPGNRSYRRENVTN